MNNFVVVGLNHRTATLDIRQLASFNAIQLPEGLRDLSSRPGILEAMILSTCNRVEIICHVDPPSDGIESIERFLSEFSQIPAVRSSIQAVPPQRGTCNTPCFSRRQLA